MRSISIVFAFMVLINIPIEAPAEATSPAIPNEVEVVMDSNTASFTPDEGGSLISRQHGLVIWNVTSIPSNILEVKVELRIIDLGLSASIQPHPIILTRSDTEFDFDLLIAIPPGCTAKSIDYSIQGFYYHTAYPNDQRQTDTVFMELIIEPYSLVAFRELSNDDQVKIEKKRWTTIDLTLWNQGNAVDTYIVSIECQGGTKVRYDDTPLLIGIDEFRKYQFEVYTGSNEPAIVVIRVMTDHPAVNETGEIRFTLYVDSTSDILSANIINIGIGAGIALSLIGLSAFLWLWMRARRKKRSKVAKGQG